MNPFYNSTSSLLFLILLLWTIPWKVYALWTASKHDHRKWFVALIILNTFSILEIFYIFYVAKKTTADVKKAAHGAMSWISK